MINFRHPFGELADQILIWIGVFKGQLGLIISGSAIGSCSLFVASSVRNSAALATI